MMANILKLILGQKYEEVVNRSKEKQQLREAIREATKEVEKKYQEELTREYPVDETIKLTKTNLNKLIRWTTSRFNHYRKAEVVQEIYDLAKRKEDCVREWHCGTYSDPNRYSSSGDRWEYKLVVYQGVAKLIVNDEKVYELR